MLISYEISRKLQGGQQMFETKFQDFSGLFELKTPIFPGPN